MEKQELHDRLERLHAELSQIDSVDPEEREMLAHLVADIRVLLDRPEANRQPAYAQLGTRLRSSVGRLEASYPRATLLMGQVIDTLAGIGL
jgi:hypothetical protein